MFHSINGERKEAAALWLHYPLFWPFKKKKRSLNVVEFNK